MLAETLRAALSPCTTCSSRSTCPGLNTTLTSLNLNRNCLGEGAGRALAETLRQTSLSLSYRQLRPSVICLIVNKLLSLSLSLSLAVNAGARAPRGGVTRQGVVLTDLKSFFDCQ